MWQVIYRILHPNPTPLRSNVDTLNEHFASTATRTTGVQTSDTKEDLIAFLDALQPEESPTGNGSFTLRPGTCYEVLLELKHLRSDTSTGPDLIPAKFLKPIAKYIASPLTDIIKSVNPKISRIGRQKRKNDFFLIWPKEPIWLPV